MAPQSFIQPNPAGMTPLRVAGVAGGVGTSTVVRVLRMLFPQVPVVDLGQRRGEVDILVTSNTVSSARMIGEALGRTPRPPMLVVVHTAPGKIENAKPHLITVSPNVSAVFHIGHRRHWLEMAEAPGPELPRKGADLVKLVRGLADALTQTHVQRPRPVAAPYPVRPAALPPHHRAPVAHPPHLLPPGVIPPHPGTPGSFSPAVPRAGPTEHPWRQPPGSAPRAFTRGGQGG
jgi:hypothetical protein